ncbi:MAG: DUF5801 repeats-in-toxin domain-containing protein [Pseudomonadota bacterium]
MIDDVPTATDNANGVTEGTLVEGNLLTDNDGDGVDVDGADGYDPDGTVVAITSTNEATSQDVATVGGKLVLAGEFGTLTVDVTTGAYGYQSTANATNIDAQDVFTYTIRDADGDESTATLTIDIENVAGQVADVDVDVDEAGLSFGSDSLADSEVDANGVITVTNAVGPFKFTLTGANADGDGTYGTLVLDEDTGEYTYTLDTEYDHSAGAGRNVASVAEGFTYDVHDANGNLIGSGTINVNITDDIPSVDIGFSDADPDTLTTQDADTAGGASDTATGYVDKAFEIVSQEYGADGPGSLDVGYAMTLLAAAGTDTGLNSNGADIRIYQLANGTVVGSTALTAPTVATDPSVIFSITVNGTSGLVTLTQHVEIDHSPPGATAAPYDTQLIDLPSGLVGVTATADIEDFDVDTDSDSETIDLAGFVKFADDGPSIDAAVADGDTVVLETQDADTRGINSDTDFSTANFSGAFTVASSSYGADGAGSTAWAFSFQIENAASGMSSEGDPITLFLIDNKVVGSTATVFGDVNVTNTIFDLSVVANSGVVTLTQYAELDHADNNDTAAPYDDQLLELANDKVNLIGRATILDGDGDTAFEQVSLDLGGNVKFADDGPALTEVALGSSVDVDETPGLPQSDTSADAIISYVADFGADGQGSTSYAISIVGGGSTPLFTALGQAISLVQDGSASIKGVYDGGTKTAFVVTINANGTVTLTQNVALEHNVDGADPVTDHNDTLNLAGLINATVTITDGDFDDTSAPIGIGSALVFYDDGPSVSLSNTLNDLTVSDANYASDDTEDFSDAFTFDGGEDGTAGTSYALSVTDGDYSGLVDTATGEQVFLFLEGGAVVGRNGTDAADADATGAEVFRVTVDPSGLVELDQSRAVNHTINGGNGTSVSLLSDDLIQLVATITDNDGDTASASLDIGKNLSFTDDVPTAETTLTAYLDDDTLGGSTGGLNDQTPDTANLSGSLVDNVEGFGNDGGTVAFALTGNPVGFRYQSDGASGVNIQQEQGSGNWVTVVHVTLVPTTGAYTVSQTANIWHTDDNANDENNQSFTLNATLTDGDGDTAPVSLNIVVDDSTPRAIAATSTGTVDEDGLTGGIANYGTNDVTGADTTASSSVTGLFTAGADAPLTYGLDASSTAALGALGLKSNGDVLAYSIVGNTITATTAIGDVEVFTFTLNATSGVWNFTLKAPLDHADTNDSENAVDIQIQFASFITATDEDGDTVAAHANASVTVTVDDDTPRANPDTDSVTEDTVSTDGNVVLGTGTTSGAAGADESGADGFGDPVVTAISGFNGAGTVGGNTVGQYGTLQLGANGAYTYSPNTAALQGLDSSETRLDTFTYTIVDADGDEVSTTLQITINGANDAPVANPDTNWIVEDGTSPITGNVIAGQAHNGAPDLVNRADVADTDVDVETLTVAAADTGTINGTYGVLTLNAGGTYSYRLYTQGENSTAYAAVQALKEGDTPLADSFNYNATDGTAESNETSLVISIFGSNDAPVVGSATVATSDEGFTNGNKDTTGNPTDTTNLLTASGAVSIADVDDAVYTVSLAVPTETLAVADGTATGAAISWSLTNGGKTLLGTINGGANTAITVTIDNLGGFTVTQSLPIFHSNTTVEDVKTFTVDVSVNDGTTTVTKTDAITVNLEDDSPFAVAAKVLSTATNAAGTYQQFLDADNNIDNNVGGDGGRVIFTQDSIDALVSQNLTSGLASLNYSISENGTVLTAVKQGTNIEVFTITLDPDSANNQYVLDLSLPLDATQEVNFTDGTYDFVGGNTGWAGFVPDGEPTTGTNNESSDLLLTPAVGGAPSSTINQSSVQYGVGSGNSIGLASPGNPATAETFRLDFVTDLRGNSAGSGGYSVPGNRDQVFDSHYQTNGASVLFTASSGTTLKFEAFDDPDGNNTVGDGVLDGITGVAISYKGFTTGIVTPTLAGTSYTIGPVGDQHTYIVTLNADGKTVNISGLYGTSGAAAEGTTVAIYTDTSGVLGVGEPAGYNSLQFTYVSGDEIKVGDFGATVITNDPVSFTVPISVVDNDGDMVDSGELSITLTPPPVVPPVVLDLDGGGNTFTPLSEGIAYDYDGDGVKSRTAWIALGSAILAFDSNADGFVNDASEFVFGNGDMTDLEAIAAKYDGNGDGVLDANDAAYGSFGLWIDADLDAVSDAGEFVSLADAGVTAIELVSDGNLAVEADGDVVVYGTASYTMADGSTADVSDAGFMTGGEIDMALMDALLMFAQSSGDLTALPDDQLVVEVAVQDALGEAMVESFLADFAAMESPQATDLPMRSEGHEFAALLDANIGSGEIQANIVQISDISDESSMALAVNG